MNTSSIQGRRLSRRASTLSAVLCAATLLVPCGRVLGQFQAQRISSVADVIDQWNAEQHLYVKGDLGVDNRRYADLERWLSEHGPHWTVVLMQDAAGERYTAADGRTYQGMDAVEVALGHGLANRTNFGKLENPLTGETDGAVFVLFLRERKFSYYGSDAQDRRGLGESHWIGELDRPAIRAMRGGGRILDAVKDTVESINGKLNRAIQAEMAEEQQRERRRKRDLNATKLAIDEARTAAKSVALAAQDLKRMLPDAQGELTSPPVADWDRRLDALGVELTDQNLRETRQQTADLNAEIQAFLNAYAAFHSFDQVVDKLKPQIRGLKEYPNQVAAPMIKQATDSLNQAQERHADGDPAFAESLREAQQFVQQGDAAGSQEQERLRQAAARRRLIRISVAATIAIVAIVLLGVLIYLNRRRAETKSRVLKSFHEREKSVRSEMDRVVELFDRSAEILGSKQKIVERGYEGRTRDLCQHAFQNVDELLIMSNEVDRVMDEARGLILPRHWYGQLINAFSAAPYERGLNRISGEPLNFYEDQGIPAILQPDSAKGPPPSSMSLTFERVFEAFHQRCGDTAAMLERIETSMVEVNDQLQELQKRIDDTTQIEQQLTERYETDGFFCVPAFFETLLPSAQADCDQADDLAGLDPVQAVEQQIPSGNRKIDEAQAISTSIRRARNDVFPDFDQHAPRLQQLDYQTDWIEESVQQLGETANQLLATAAESSVGSEAKAFDEAVTEIGRRVEQCAELAQDLHDNHRPAIETLASAISEARDQIATGLGVPLDQCLHEQEQDPDQRMRAAREQLAAARAALQHGEIDAGNAAAEAVCEEVTSGHLLVDNSLEVLAQFADWHHEYSLALDKADDRLPHVQGRVREECAPFAPSAQRLKAGDPSCPDEHATTTSRLEEARDLFQDAHNLLRDAQVEFQQGRLLQSRSHVKTAASQTKRGEMLLDEVETHIDRLNEQSQANAGRLNSAVTNIRATASEVQDPRTTRPTLDAFEALQQQLTSVNNRIEADGRDPFDNAFQLDALDDQTSHLRAKIEADRNSHAEATRAVNGAAKQLTTALQYVGRARRDGIPDSPLTVRCVREIQASESALDHVRGQLQDSHGDWAAVDDAAARLNKELGAQSAQLAGELDAAQKSVDALERASREVFAATRWTGGYGVNVVGSPGANELERARQALNRGDYDGLAQLSRAATMAAQYAVQRAIREVERRRREEARREEERRRREAERRRRMSPPSISFGPSHSSSGSPISFGGGGSSSPSGSGFQRSGW